MQNNPKKEFKKTIETPTPLTHFKFDASKVILEVRSGRVGQSKGLIKWGFSSCERMRLINCKNITPILLY